MTMHNVLSAAAKAVAIGMMTGAFAVGAAPISVALDGDDVVARVPAGTLDETSALYLVWDGEDRGTNPADWPVANRFRCDIAKTMVTMLVALYSLNFLNALSLCRSRPTANG